MENLKEAKLLSELTRIAFENPQWRKTLIPLLKESSSGWVDLKGGSRDPYLDEVWDMYVKTYAKIGLTVSSPADFIRKYKLWKLFLDGGTPIAFSLLKETPYGKKTGLLGSNMEPQGKNAVKSYLKTRFQKEGNLYGEVSHAVEHISLKAGAPVVCNAHVPKVLGKTIDPSEDGIHYTRKIGPITAEKVMVGNPKGIPSTPYNKALEYCPLVMPSPQGRELELEQRMANMEKDAVDVAIAQAEHLCCLLDWN